MAMIKKPPRRKRPAVERAKRSAKGGGGEKRMVPPDPNDWSTWRKFNMRWPPALEERMRRCAADEQFTGGLSALVREAVEEYLKKCGY